MLATLTFKDETLSGRLIQAIEVPVDQETMTLRELIMLRVAEEIKRLEDESYQRFLSLSEQERALNGKQWSKHPNGPDPEGYGYRALDAFKRNAFLVLVDDRQVDELEMPITLSRQTTVSFVKMTPLVGG